MHHGGRVTGRTLLVAGAAVLALLAGCGGDDDSSSDTLSPIDGSPTGGTTPPVGTTAPSGAAVGTAVEAGAAGSGFVTIDVQLASVGVTETISLDRSTVSADSLDPVSLDATCTPLDGGDVASGLDVSVVDLRRLASDKRILSAALHVADGAAAGEHDVTLEVSGADQVTTTYTGTVQLAEGGWSGTFDTADASGAAATGSFACAAAPIPTTVASSATDGGEEIPDASAPG